MKLRKLVAGPIGRLLCLVLALALATGPTAQVLAQSPANTSGAGEPTPLVQGLGDTTLVAAPDAGKIDLTYVTPQAVALAAGRPRQVLTAPGAEMLPLEIIAAVGEQHLGFQPIDVVEFTLFIEPPMAGPPGYGLALRFAKPFNLPALKEPLRSHTRRAELGGKEYLQSVDPMAPSFFMPDETTLLAANDATLRRLIEQQSTANKPSAGSGTRRAVELRSLRGCRHGDDSADDQSADWNGRNATGRQVSE